MEAVQHMPVLASPSDEPRTVVGDYVTGRSDRGDDAPVGWLFAIPLVMAAVLVANLVVIATGAWAW